MDATGTVVHVERVCCLECATKYMKPASGGTVDSNPGCPRCGSIGWILAFIAPRRFPQGHPPGGQRRYGAGPHQSSVVQPR